MRTVNPYLIFERNGEEAMRFYHSVLGGNLSIQKFGDTPGCEGMPPEMKDGLMHGALEIDGDMLMASDSAGQPYEGMKGFMVAMTFPSIEEGKRVFDALAAGGKVTMPWGETFWAKGFGMLVDQYGTAWGINGAPTYDPNPQPGR